MNNQLGYAIISITPAIYWGVGRIIIKIPTQGIWKFPRIVLFEIRNDIQNIILLSGFSYSLILFFPKIQLFVIIWKLGLSFQFLLICIALINILSNALTSIVQKLSDTNDQINYITAIPLLVSVVKIGFYFIWLMSVLSIFGADVRPFFQGTALVAFIIGLAGQKTIESVFGTLLIFSDKIYRVGSRIKYKEYTGEVIRITIFRTFIRTTEGHIIAITNNDIGVVTVLES